MHLCTYFDGRYLSRGLALYGSLCRHAPAAHLYVLCMDGRAYESLMKLELPRVHPIKLADFEARDDELAAAKANRTLVEYYFTCTPSLPLYVLDRFPGIERIFYIDADFYFFSPATALLDDWGQGSIYLVAHRFPDSLRERE